MTMNGLKTEKLWHFFTEGR